MFKHFFVRLFLPAVTALVLFPGLGKAQVYDAFTVLRLPDRTIYFYPQGYAPTVPLSFYYPSAYYYPTVFDAYRFSPYNSYPFAANPYNSTSFTPLSFEPTSASLPQLDNTSITLRVPRDAEVWIQGKKMKETGIVRQFTLPSLDPAKTYDYDVRVTWSENGRQVSDDHHLKIRGGDSQSLTYVAALAKP